MILTVMIDDVIKKSLSLMAIFGKYFLYPCITSGVRLPSLEKKKKVFGGFRSFRISFPISLTAFRNSVTMNAVTQI